MMRQAHFLIGMGAAHTLVLCASLLLGCSRQVDRRTEIRFWAMGSEGEHVGKLLPEFERRNPDLVVRLQAIPWTAAHEKLLTAYAGNSTPDLCQLGNTWIPEFVILNAIEPLDQWMRNSRVTQQQGYFSGIWETNLIDSVLYGIPWYVDTRLFFYRKDLLARAGFTRFPRTWKEWDAACAGLVSQRSRGETFALLLPTNEWAPTVILGLQAGSPLLAERNTVGAFSQPQFARAFAFYTDFFKKSYAPIGVMRVQNIYQGMSEGFFAMYITGPWNVGEFSRRLPPELQNQWMTAPMPGPDEQTPGVSLAGGSSLVMFRRSLHKPEAWRLIEYLSEPEQQIAFYRHTGDLPARIEAWRDSALASNVYMRAFEEQLQHVVPTPQIPEWEQIAMKVQDYAEVASRGVMSTADALHALDRDVDRILEKRRWIVYGK